MAWRSRAVATGMLLVLLLARAGPGAGAAAGEDEPKARLAERLYTTGYLMTLLGRYEDAIGLFRRSLEIEPTAEAHTFLGWTYSHRGEYQRAIEEAAKAIPLDPEFGNPYNDIGVYLIELGREDEAIPYLERAMRARRYCCYQFPHFNLGRIYVKKKLYGKAREEFRRALAVDPDYAPAREALRVLDASGVDEI